MRALSGSCYPQIPWLHVATCIRSAKPFCFNKPPDVELHPLPFRTKFRIQPDFAVNFWTWCTWYSPRICRSRSGRWFLTQSRKLRNICCRRCCTGNISKLLLSLSSREDGRKNLSSYAVHVQWRIQGGPGGPGPPWPPRFLQNHAVLRQFLGKNYFEQILGSGPRPPIGVQTPPTDQNPGSSPDVYFLHKILQQLLACNWKEVVWCEVETPFLWLKVWKRPLQPANRYTRQFCEDANRIFAACRSPPQRGNRSREHTLSHGVKVYSVGLFWPNSSLNPGTGLKWARVYFSVCASPNAQEFPFFLPLYQKEPRLEQTLENSVPSFSKENHLQGEQWPVSPKHQKSFHDGVEAKSEKETVQNCWQLSVTRESGYTFCWFSVNFHSTNSSTFLEFPSWQNVNLHIFLKLLFLFDWAIPLQGSSCKNTRSFSQFCFYDDQQTNDFAFPSSLILESRSPTSLFSFTLIKQCCKERLQTYWSWQRKAKAKCCGQSSLNLSQVQCALFPSQCLTVKPESTVREV